MSANCRTSLATHPGRELELSRALLPRSEALHRKEKGEVKETNATRRNERRVSPPPTFVEAASDLLEKKGVRLAKKLEEIAGRTNSTKDVRPGVRICVKLRSEKKEA